MPMVGKKKYPYTKKGKMVGKAMLTAKQKTLPKQLQEKIIKSKMKKKKKKK